MPVVDSLLNLIAPHECVGCLRQGVVLCATCRSALPVRQPACPLCNRLNNDGRTCEGCLQSSNLAGATVATNYDGIITKLLWDLKYESKVAAASALSQLISPLLSPTDFDVVTAIPGSPSRYRKRSYHQAELIARSLANELCLPYRPLLGRYEVESQVGSGRSERLTKVKGTFWAKRPKHTSDHRVLIIDDVLTTGATLDEAAAVLKLAGATSVWGAVAAKH